MAPTTTASTTTSTHEFVFADTIDHGKYTVLNIDSLLDHKTLL